jgi:hypothetical protein
MKVDILSCIFLKYQRFLPQVLDVIYVILYV